MKKYKHKQTGWIAIKRDDNEYNVYTKAENFLFQTAKELIENTNDWEEVKPEPKYEVGDWVKTIDGKIGIIINTAKGNYENIFIEGVGWTHDSQIKCKVKPVKLQFGLCKNKMGYYIPQTYFDVNTSILNNSDYHSTHSITVYEEVEE